MKGANQMSDHLKRYVQPLEEEQLETYVESHPFFEWANSNAHNFQNIHCDAIASYFNDLDIVNSDYVKGFQQKLNAAQQEHFQRALSDPQASENYPISIFRNLQYSCDHISVVEEILGNAERMCLENRGFHENKKGYDFNANSFGNHVLKRVQLLQSKREVKYAYYNGMYQVLAENEYSQILSSFIRELEKVKWRKSYQNEYLAVMSNLIPICETTSNPKNKVSLQNGYLDLMTGDFHTHDSNVMFFSQLGYEYDSQAKCPNFQHFINDIFDGDTERIDLIQEILGYVLWDGTEAQKFFVFLGNGANGKSVLAQLMTLLYGEQNISSTPLKRLDTSFGFQDLEGKWLNLAAENEHSGAINTEALKGISSGDRVLVDKKYKDPTTELLRTKLILIMNNMFRTTDKTNGFYRRLVIIPFEKTFVEYTGGEKRSDISYRDPKLYEKIAPEISGIFNFAIEGLERLKNNNWIFTSSEKCNGAMNQYRMDVSPEEMFFASMLEYSQGDNIKQSDVHKKYQDWSKRYESKLIVSPRSIVKRLEEYAELNSWKIEKYKNNVGHIRNLKWKNDSNGSDG